MDLTPQIDVNRLKQAIEFVRCMGSGTVMQYTQSISDPHQRDVYIRIRLTAISLEFDAFSYGGFEFPAARRAVVAIANDILGEQ